MVRSGAPRARTPGSKIGGPTISLRRFADHADAGRRLADALADRWCPGSIVLALVRGGVPVAAEIAERFDAELEAFVVRKVGMPGHRELGIGAVAEGGVVVADEAALRAMGIDRATFDGLVAEEVAELERRVRRYRRGRPLPPLGGRDIVLVDDGLATGVTAEAAVRAMRTADPRSIVLAVPVCAPRTADRLGAIADDVVCLHAPSRFVAVGQWYDRFDQVTDDEVERLLDLVRRRFVPGASPSRRP
jgi:putative phosphoribosyl transferase